MEPTTTPTSTEEEKKNAPAANGTPKAIITAGIIIALAIVFVHYAPGSGALPSDNGQPSTAQAVKVNIKDVDISGDPFIGKENAPITIAYWSDWQCPFCKRFETTAMQDIMKNYVDTGKVKIVFKDFQFLGPDSNIAGLYGRAVWDLYPAQYYAWREAMFNAQDEEHSGFGDEPSIKKLTATINGIDGVKVSAAITANTNKYQGEMDADKTEATKFGVNGTPGVVIGKQVISGAQAYAAFQAAIEAAK